MKTAKKLLLIASALGLVIILSSCAAVPFGSAGTADYADENYFTANETAYDMAKADGGYEAINTAAAVSDRKVISTYDFTVESDDIDSAAKSLEETAVKSGGFISHLDFGGRGEDGKYASATVIYRIPADNTGSFKNAIENAGTVVNKSEKSEDVTETYIDKEGRLATLKIQEARLLELLSKSGNLSDLLTIERELAGVREQIENLTGTLKRYDNLVSLATFTVQFRLPRQGVPADDTSFGGAFADSFGIALYILKIAIIGIIYLLPYLLVIGAALTITLLIVKKKRKK